MSDNLWAGKSVLIVDDSERMRLELAAIYSDLGLRVANMAKDGVEGIKLFQKEKPDLVSLDIIMPEMHGIDCFRRLLAVEPNLKYLFVSCLASDANVIAAFDGVIPADRFVAKPASYESIRQALATIFALGLAPTQTVSAFGEQRSTVA